VAEFGPGAVMGERAIIEGGTRTATLTALTPVRLAVAEAADIDRASLERLAETHHREDQPA
jgi:CRP-like cAMP-binding protein